jgi:hypothetical protein
MDNIRHGADDSSAARFADLFLRLRERVTPACHDANIRARLREPERNAEPDPLLPPVMTAARPAKLISMKSAP